MYETIRIVGQVRPKYVLWENVKNILSKKHKHNFDSYIETMNVLGYNSYYQVLNSKDYGIPQNRERVYTVSIRKDIDNGTFVFPGKEELHLRLKDMLEDEVEEKYYLSDKAIAGLKRQEELKHKPNYIENKDIINVIDTKVGEGTHFSPYLREVGKLDIKGHDCVKRVYSKEGISPTLTDMQGGNRQPKVMYDYKVRKLTPLECWRLMGFNDEDFEKVAGVPTSNTQLYKQAGNSIVVNVLEKIFKNLFMEVKDESCNS